ncbi:MAG: hypothetical protein ACPG52_02300 [Cognaticolwellia sp.]
MDIFTTVLTRVVPVPIKKANLKVKALAKKAPAHGVSDDIQGLEDHELFLKKPSDQQQLSQVLPQTQPQPPQELEVILGVPVDEIIEPSPVPSDNTGQHIDLYDDSAIPVQKIEQAAEQSTEQDAQVDDKNDKPHLDIFI